MSHTSVTCDWTYHFSHTWRNIVCSPDLPELICVWKTCDIVFWWVFLSIYLIKLYSHLCEQLYVCFVFPIQTTWCSLGNFFLSFHKLCSHMRMDRTKFEKILWGTITWSDSTNKTNKLRRSIWHSVLGIEVDFSNFIGLCCCVEWEWDTFEKESSFYYLHFFK